MNFHGVLLGLSQDCLILQCVPYQMKHGSAKIDADPSAPPFNHPSTHHNTTQCGVRRLLATIIGVWPSSAASIQTDRFKHRQVNPQCHYWDFIIHSDLTELLHSHRWYTAVFTCGRAFVLSCQIRLNLVWKDLPAGSNMKYYTASENVFFFY